MIFRTSFKVFFLGLLVISSMALTGCSKSSYPDIKESLLEICRKEYGIDFVDVKIEGTTIGVYLPLAKLFAEDFQELINSGRIRNVENLFQPSEEAIEKIEDLLFAISRVILSTDKNLEFYSLQVTDINGSGLQLMLKGYVNDIKRVRIWDIPRSEYRKRIIHELHLNQAILWHKPVRQFFDDLEASSLEDVRKKYFGSTLPAAAIQRLFFDILSNESPREPEDKLKWHIVDMRSIDLDKNGAVVYAKMKPVLIKQERAVNLAENELEYLFLISINGQETKIVRIIPFQYQDEEGKWTKISFPKELQLEKNLSEWKEEFTLEPMNLGSFLAQQLARRIQAMLAEDERINNTFRNIAVDLSYQTGTETPSFAMHVQSELKDENIEGPVVKHEDMVYALTLIYTEFLKVVRSYSFGDYGLVRLHLGQDPMPVLLNKEALELFRRNKVDMLMLLSL